MYFVRNQLFLIYADYARKIYIYIHTGLRFVLCFINQKDILRFERLSFLAIQLPFSTYTTKIPSNCESRGI